MWRTTEKPKGSAENTKDDTFLLKKLGQRASVMQKAVFKELYNCNFCVDIFLSLRREQDNTEFRHRPKSDPFVLFSSVCLLSIDGNDSSKAVE